jgi:hypothetical protein
MFADRDFNLYDCLKLKLSEEFAAEFYQRQRHDFNINAIHNLMWNVLIPCCKEVSTLKRAKKMTEKYGYQCVLDFKNPFGLKFAFVCENWGYGLSREFHVDPALVDAYDVIIFAQQSDDGDFYIPGSSDVGAKNLNFRLEVLAYGFSQNIRDHSITDVQCEYLIQTPAYALQVVKSVENIAELKR